MGNVLIAGAADIDITPPMGVEMCGYGPYEKRVCREVLDPVYARALWLRSGETSLAIIGADLCAVDSVTRDRVAQEISHQTGTPAAHVMIAASHVHSAPTCQYLIGYGERDPAYIEELVQLMIQVAINAHAAAAPARLGACRQRINGVGINRNCPDVGPVDTAAQLLRIDRLSGETLAVVFNFGAHPTTRFPYSSRISADWPGMVAAQLKFAFPQAIPLFLQAPCGDINAHRMTWRSDPVRNIIVQQLVSDARVGEVAQRLSEQIIPAARQIETKADARLNVNFKTIHLPCTVPDRKAIEQRIEQARPITERMSYEELRPLHERYETETEAEVEWRNARFEVDTLLHQLHLLDHPPYEYPAPLQVMRIGEAALVGWPGEIFVELGLELRQRSPIPLTFVAECANHTVSYIASRAVMEHNRKHYPIFKPEQYYGCLPLRSDVGTILIDETLKMLAQV